MIQVNNLEPKDDALRKPKLEPKKDLLKPVAENKPSAPNTDLTEADLKSQARLVFLQNFADILKTSLTGSPIRLVVVGIILLLAVLFGLKIL